MSDFLGVSKVEVNERFLDQVAAGQRESLDASRQPPGSAEGRAAVGETTAAARAQARALVMAYFSPGQENG